MFFIDEIMVLLYIFKVLFRRIYKIFRIEMICCLGIASICSSGKSWCRVHPKNTTVLMTLELGDAWRST